MQEELESLKGMADPRIVGKKLRFNFGPATIVGVAPEGFNILLYEKGTSERDHVKIIIAVLFAAMILIFFYANAAYQQAAAEYQYQLELNEHYVDELKKIPGELEKMAAAQQRAAVMIREKAAAQRRWYSIWP
jgi:hypothetical protein